MKKVLVLLFLIPIISFSQKTNNYLSIGFLDHKTGSSFIGYTRTIVQNKNNELFVGVGTMLSVNTISIGLKKYLVQRKIKCYSVLCAQSIYGMGGNFNAPSFSFGIETRLIKKLFINAGVNSIVRLYDENTEFITFPSLNLNLRY
tara:strand:+ start:263 stop:697 length:435 start_codon:yes stop_codon:yes gene_type:complete